MSTSGEWMNTSEMSTKRVDKHVDVNEHEDVDEHEWMNTRRGARGASGEGMSTNMRSMREDEHESEWRVERG